MANTSTLVADGNEIFRHGLSSILRDADFEICSEIDNGALILTAFESLTPHLCVISFDMPEIQGIQIAKIIAKKYSTTRILIMADSASEDILDKFLDSGAHGLLLKSADKILLAESARKILQRETVLGSQFSDMMTREYLRLSRIKKGEKSLITPREKEVISYLIKGYTSAEIAEKLFISPRTVDKHRTNILKKLNQKNTAGLVRFALENRKMMS